MERARNRLDESGWESKKSKAQEKLKDDSETRKRRDSREELGKRGKFESRAEQNEKETEELMKRPKREGEEYEELSRAKPRFGEIASRDEFDAALKEHPDLRMQKSFENKYESVKDYFEKGEDATSKPELLDRVEKRELRRLWIETHSDPPDVPIRTMKDVEDLLDKYPEMREAEKFDESHRKSEVFFKVRSDKSSTREQLAKIHGVAPSTAGAYRAGRETRLISRLRKREEERMIRDWAELESKRKEDGRNSDSHSRKGLEHPSIYKAESDSVRRALSKLSEADSLSTDELTKAINRMFPTLFDRPERVQHADLRGDPSLNKKDRDRLENQFRKNRDDIQRNLSKEGREVRLGVVDGRLYVWKPETNPRSLSYAWKDEYFYFRDRKDFARFIDETRRHMGVSGSLHDSKRHLNNLMKQMLQHDGQDAGSMRDPIGQKPRRLRGDALKFSLDAQGAKLSDLEGRIAKITGEFGNAGIQNPKFPEGEKLGLLRARLTATFMSDGHLRPSGRIGYVERDADRIKLVKDTLKQLGDVEIKGYRRDGLREFEIPREIGAALIRWGDMTPGDKAITNPGLPKAILEGPDYVKKSYLKEMIPEDGSFHPSRGFQWNRSHAIHAGDKTDEYGFKSPLAAKHVDFIKKHGEKREGTVEGWSLSFGKLRELVGYRNPEESEIAKDLLDSVMASPNRLLDDERNLVRSLGISVGRSPERVRYYEKSGRISVRWRAGTTSIADAIKWAEMCPPNDVKKRRQVDEWLRKRRG